MANLRKTDLANANLSNCCLERANLSGAHMDVRSLESDFNLISPYSVTYKAKREVQRISNFINLFVTLHFRKALIYLFLNTIITMSDN